MEIIIARFSIQLMTSYHFAPLRWYMDFSFHYRHLLSRRNAKGTKPSGTTIGEIRELRHIEEGPTIQRGRREMGGWPNRSLHAPWMFAL